MGKVSAFRDPDWMYQQQEGIFCAACGDEILSAEPSFFTGSVHIHEECAKEYIMEEFSIDELARQLGFIRQ